MNKRKKIVFSIVIIVFLICVVSVSIYCFIHIFGENQSIESEADKLLDLKDTVVTDFIVPDAVATDSDNSDPLLRQIDFDALKDINTDVAAWLYIPDTPIDGYVMQEQTVGKYYYLWRDINKKMNNCGSFLIPKEPSDAGEDAHTLIFGHRMGSSYKKLAFSSLSEYKSKSYCEEHPYVYLYYPDRTEQWQVWTACESTSSDKVYQMPYTLGSDSYDDLLQQIQKKSLYQNTNAPSSNAETLVLSTCDGKSHSSDRFYLVCVRVGVY